jgi:chaperone BCS1
MLPSQTCKYKICKNNNIYLEIVVNDYKIDDDKDNKKSSNTEKIYTYKITISGANKYYILEEFINKCIEKYEREIDDSSKQFIFEFVTTQTDDNDRKSLKFLKYPFNSNKFLDKNIFFEKKHDFIEYIDRFKKDPGVKNKYEQDYEDAGVTFKAGILMYGPPGCGKSCTIRGILNRTGRHGILISWSKIKTSRELCSLFRRLTINDKEYDLKDVCFIVEDFDANNDQVLKVRANDRLVYNNNIKQLDVVDSKQFDNMDKDQLVNELTKTKNILELTKTALSSNDELTLDCVLNLLDGIVELHNAMFIFTTNHLENIDPAFLRPGRIDYIIELKKATVRTIREMVEYRFRSYGINMNNYDLFFDKMRDYAISPAEIQNICFKHSAEKIEECLSELIEKCNE